MKKSSYTNLVLGAFFVIFLLLIGVGAADAKDEVSPKYVEVDLLVTCLDGVEYWVSPKYFTHGGMIAPKYNKRGTLVGCTE